jgi:hypothetical protein
MLPNLQITVLSALAIIHLSVPWMVGLYPTHALPSEQEREGEPGREREKEREREGGGEGEGRYMYVMHTKINL